MSEQEKFKVLADFVKSIIRTECWNECLDGGDVQDRAVEQGILIPCVIEQDDIDSGLLNDEVDWEVGDTAYNFADWLRQPAAATS